MGTTSEKLTYLNGTKTALKDMINLSGAGITSETTFRNYATKLYDGYVEILKDKYTLLDAMPKGTGTGVNVNVQDAVDLPVYNLEMDKESTQDGEPSPDYPQEVNTVKGYRNLLETGVGTNTSYGLNIDYNNASFEVKGTLTNTYFIYLIKTLTNNISAGTYTLSRTDTTTNLNIRVTYTDNTQYTDYMGNNKTKKIVFDKEVKQIQLFSDSLTSGTYYEFTNNIQIVEGDIILPFVPYGNNYIYTKVIGKNLFDYNLFETFTTSIKYLTLQLKANTQYTMSSNIPVTSGVGANLFFMKDGETASTGTNDIRPNLSRTLTTDSTGVVKIGYRNAGGLIDPITNYWYQIEEGSTATSYESYKETIVLIPLNNNEIVGIGNYKDELLVDKSGNVFINKKTGKVVLDGSESNWAVNNSVFYRTIIDKIKAKTKMFSNNFIYVNNSWPNLNNYEMTDDATTTTIFIKDEDYLNVNDFKTWLGTHNTDVYYVLAQEELIDLQTTIDIELFNGTNNISNSEDANMQIRYVKNIEI